MTPIKRRKTVEIDISKASTERHLFDDGRSERLALRIHELDKEYEQQLVNLKKVAREVRHDLTNST